MRHCSRPTAPHVRQRALTEPTPRAGAFAARNATSYLILNLSDAVPVPLSSRAVMAFAWDPNAVHPRGDDPAGDADAFVAAWASAQFGASTGPAVAALARSYFSIPYLLNASYSPSPDGNLPNDEGAGGAAAASDVAAQGQGRAHSAAHHHLAAPTPPTVTSAPAGDQHLSVLVRDMAVLLRRAARAGAPRPSTQAADMAAGAARLAKEAASVVRARVAPGAPRPRQRGTLSPTPSVDPRCITSDSRSCRPWWHLLKQCGLR